jgi:hypothetical protein
MAFREKFRLFVSETKVIEPEIKIELSDLAKPEAKMEESCESKIETHQETKPKEAEKVEIPVINEKEEFASLDLSKDDILSLKRLAFADILQEEITISELVDLVLLAKSNKEIKSKNRDSLYIREYVDTKGKITTKGKVYLEEDTTKTRLRDILQ